MKKLLTLIYLFFTLSIFAQQYQFPVSNNNYGVYNFNNQNGVKEDYFLLSNHSKGFNFDVLDKNLALLFSYSYTDYVPYNFYTFYKNIKRIGERIIITKTFLNPNVGATSFEATYVFNLKTKAFEKIIYQNGKDLTLSNSQIKFNEILKGQNGTDLSEVFPIESNKKLYYIVESYVIPKVALFGSKMKENTIKILDEEGKTVWSLYKNYKEKENLTYQNLINIIDGKVFILENNFENRRNLTGSELKIYDVETGKLLSSISMNGDSQQFLEINKIEKFEDKFIIIGLYKNPAKNFTELQTKSYSGIFKWIIDSEGNTVSRNFFSWTRFSKKLDFFIGKNEGKENYLNPIRNFETKKGFSILLKNESSELYSFETKNYFLVNFDVENNLVSFKKYFRNELELIDYKYFVDDRLLTIIEMDNFNRKNKLLKIANSDSDFISKIIKIDSEDSEPNSIGEENKILMINKIKNNIILNFQPIK
ncbi:hypothetical protein [Empedobacter falsenii]